MDAVEVQNQMRARERVDKAIKIVFASWPQARSLQDVCVC